ncbi:hypothetical protein LCGC14_1151780 [marine sediment metagenome]|uniref:Uncharacterized protein n=1 Tax=marine sediment metagenome TaxID=412755 RepID=A0A0F9PDD7_9ZZZZ
MRDPERIDRLLSKVGEWWKVNPEWRLGQLLVIAARQGNHDVFYLEDDDLEAYLDE